MYVSAVRIASAITLTCLAVGARGAAGEAERPLRRGDRVVVTSGPAPIKVGADTITTINAGKQLTIVEVQESWAKVVVDTPAGPVHGWVHLKRLRRLADDRPKPGRPPAARAPLPSIGGLSEGTLIRLVAVAGFSLLLAFLLYAMLHSFGRQGSEPSARADRHRAGERGRQR